MKKILSLDIFVILSKFTYGAYLLNPIFILSVLSSRYYPFYIDNVTIVSIMKLFHLDNFDVVLVLWNNVSIFQGTLFIAIVVCSFIASILLFVTVEMPFASLLKLCNGAPKKRKEVDGDKFLWVIIKLLN